MSRYPRAKVVTYAVAASMLVAVIVWGWLALADPGTRIDWQLPGISRDQVLADVEVKSVAGEGWSRYLIVLAEPDSTAEELTRQIRAALKEAGWETRPDPDSSRAVEADSGSKHATFGPANRRRLYVPRSVKELIETTEGPVRRKVAVGMAEY